MPRLDRLMARNWGASRKQVTGVIRTGRVVLPDGQIPRDPAFVIADALLPYTITVDDEPLVLRDTSHLLLNKPPGYVTALRDREHPIASTLIHNAPLFDDLRAVGRLDMDTTGLLIWTTDGQLVHRLTHPRSAIPRSYHAALARPHQPVPAGFTLEDGHQPQIVELAPLVAAQCHPALQRPPEAAVFAKISIVGGAYHEVRRIFAALGSHVLALCRVSFGSVQLPEDLPIGQWVPLDDLAERFPSKPSAGSGG